MKTLKDIKVGGTATITATINDGISNAKSTKTASVTIRVVEKTSSDPEYVIYSDGYAMTDEHSGNTATGGSASYTYKGMAGVKYTSGSGSDESMRWIFEETDGGYYIKNIDGQYLTATYTSGNSSGSGDVNYTDDPEDVWVLDSGYSLDNGEVNGS